MNDFRNLEIIEKEMDDVVSIIETIFIKYGNKMINNEEYKNIFDNYITLKEKFINIINSGEMDKEKKGDLEITLMKTNMLELKLNKLIREYNDKKL